MTPLSLIRPDSETAQYRVLRTMHEGFARSLANALSAFFQCEISSELEEISFLGAAEFRKSLPAPSCLISFQLEPLPDSAVLAMECPTVFQLLELLLGGKPGSTTEPRALTEIEWSLLEEVIRVLVSSLGESWKTVHAVEFKVQSLESDPEFLPPVDPAVRLVQLSFKLQYGEQTGSFRVGLPQMFFESEPSQPEAPHQEPNPEDAERNLALLSDATVDVEVLLDGPAIHFKEIAALSAGQVVQFDFPLTKSLRALVNGTVSIPGRMMSSGRKRAFQVERIP